MDTKRIPEIFLLLFPSQLELFNVFIASDEGQNSVLTHFQQEETSVLEYSFERI